MYVSKGLHDGFATCMLWGRTYAEARGVSAESMNSIYEHLYLNTWQKKKYTHKNVIISLNAWLENKWVPKCLCTTFSLHLLFWLVLSIFINRLRLSGRPSFYPSCLCIYSYLGPLFWPYDAICISGLMLQAKPVACHLDCFTSTSLHPPCSGIGWCRRLSCVQWNLWMQI